MDCTGLYLVDCTGLYWAVLGCTGLYWAVLGWTWLKRAVLDCARLYWAVLGHQIISFLVDQKPQQAPVVQSSRKRMILLQSNLTWLILL